MRQTQTEGHPTKYLISTVKKCQGHAGQGKMDELSQIRGD